MNQAMGGFQNRENIWTGIKRAVPFLKVNANRNEEDGLQKQAFLNVLPTCCSTQQLQPSFVLKLEPGLQTLVTPAHHRSGVPNPAEGDRRARPGPGPEGQLRPFSTPLQRVSYPAWHTFHLQFQNLGGEESQQSTPTGTSMKKSDSTREVVSQ